MNITILFTLQENIRRFVFYGDNFFNRKWPTRKNEIITVSFSFLADRFLPSKEEKEEKQALNQRNNQKTMTQKGFSSDFL